MWCVCTKPTAYHKSNHSKLHYDIYICMGGPLYIVELSDSKLLQIYKDS